MRAISKSYVRAWQAENATNVLIAAARYALSPPTGPVTFEIPIDVQRAHCKAPSAKHVCEVIAPAPSSADLDALAKMVKAAKSPILWLGGGSHSAQEAATSLADRGFAVVTSVHGRAVVPEWHANSLGAFNMTPSAERVYAAADLMIVVGSRLRGNETHNNDMCLARTLVQVDVDPSQAGRNYPVDLFVFGDARLVLEGLLDRLPKQLDTRPDFLDLVRMARKESEAALLALLGPYSVIAEVLRKKIAPGRHPWVRDVTISNSTFGNRYVQIAAPRLGVHALGGGIGQGIAMGIGAAMADTGAKTVVLLATAARNLCLASLRRRSRQMQRPSLF